MRKIFYGNAIAEAYQSAFSKDERYVYMGEDVGKFGGTFIRNGLYDQFGPDRCIEMPIAENLIVAAAMGMAIGGLRPVAELMYSDFISLAMDPIVNEAPKYRFNAAGKAAVPLTIVASSGTLDGSGVVHSQCPEAWIANIPGLKIVVPTFAADAKGLMAACLEDDDPCVYLASKSCMYIKGEVPEEDYKIPFGKANIVQEGKDVTVVAWQRSLVDTAKAAKELLKEEGISVEIIDPRTLVPFDYAAVIESVKKTGKLIVASEAPKRYSCTAEITSYVAENAFEYLKKPPVRLGSPNTPIPSFRLEEQWRLGMNEIKEAVKAIVK